MERIKIVGEIIEQEPRTTQDGTKSFHTIVVSTDQDEIKLSDWSGLCKRAGVLNKTGIFVECLFVEGQYPRLVAIKEVEKPASFTQRTVDAATSKDAQAFMPAQPSFRAGRPSDFATSQEYLAFKLAVDFTKDEQIMVGTDKLARMLDTQKAILSAWDKQKMEK